MCFETWNFKYSDSCIFRRRINLHCRPTRWKICSFYSWNEVPTGSEGLYVTFTRSNKFSLFEVKFSIWKFQVFKIPENVEEKFKISTFLNILKHSEHFGNFNSVFQNFYFFTKIKNYLRFLFFNKILSMLWTNLD